MGTEEVQLVFILVKLTSVCFTHLCWTHKNYPQLSRVQGHTNLQWYCRLNFVIKILDCSLTITLNSAKNILFPGSP